MTKVKMTLGALGALLLAAPLWGGTLYVPLAQSQQIDGNSFRTEVLFYNDAGAPRTVSYLFVEESTDGSVIDRETAFTEITVPRRSTVSRDDLVPEGLRGYLEIRAEDEVSVSARVVGENADGSEFFGAAVPVVTSRNAVTPGRTAALPGLSRKEDEVVSDFFVLNLSIESTVCAIEVLKRGGAQLAEVEWMIEPLTLVPTPDALGLLGVKNLDDVTIAVTCDQLVHAFATVHHLASAQVVYLQPAGDGTSQLDPFPTVDCPDDALFRQDGIFHVPEKGHERATFLAPSPEGTFSELHLTMEFTVGPWHRRSSGLHAIFWLNRTRQWRANVFGYLNVFGPRQNEVKLMTNVGLDAGDTEAVQKGAVLLEGTTYVVDYVYSTALNLIEAVISEKGGGEVVRLQDKPTVNKIRTGEEFMIVFGHETDEAGSEVTTYGWQYANLCLTLE